MGDDYLTVFDEEAYFQLYYTNENEKLEFPQSSSGYFQMLHDIFSRGDITGKRLLDIGSGPCIHTVIPACKYFEEIYISDYAPQNRLALDNWLSGTSVKMFPIIQHFIELEGSSMPVDERNRALVSKVRGILNIDVRKWRPLQPEEIPLVDAIVSCSCFECVASDVESYGDCIRNITPLLKHGGHLILLGALYQTMYRVGSRVLKIAYLTRENIVSILAKCGYKIVEINYAPRISEHADGKECFSLIATKKIK